MPTASAYNVTFHNTASD